MRKDFFTYNQNWLCFSAVLLFGIVSFLFPILYAGIPDGYDLACDLRIAISIQDAILSGHIIPEWANDNFGYGSIAVRFYPLVAFYTLAIGKILTGSWFSSILINLTLWMCIGCVGIYLFVKEWGTPLQAMVAGMLYAVVPQHLSEIYSYFLYAQFAAWAVIPFCFLFVTRICRKGGWNDTFYFALTYSVLILTHIPTTIIVSFCLPIYVLVVMDWTRFKQIFLNLAVAVGITVVATSFRWSQIITEVNWLSHNDPKWSTGKYGFAFWLFPNVLEQRTSFFFEMVSWLTDIIIVLTVLMLVPAVVYLFATRRSENNSARKIVLATTVTGLFAFFMASKPSFFLWDNIDFLQKIQFPWRWLSVVSMFGIVAFVLSLSRLTKIYQRFERLIVYSALSLVVTMVMFDISQIIVPAEPIQRAKFEKIERKVKTEPMFEGWWPVWAKPEAFDEIALRVSSDERVVDITRWEPTKREFSVQPGGPVKLRIATFYYPLWKAKVNGKPVDIEKDENGVMLIPIGTEASTVDVYFEEPFAVRMSSWISLVMWIFLFAAIHISYRNLKISVGR